MITLHPSTFSLPRLPRRLPRGFLFFYLFLFLSFYRHLFSILFGLSIDPKANAYDKKVTFTLLIQTHAHILDLNRIRSWEWKCEDVVIEI